MVPAAATIDTIDIRLRRRDLSDIINQSLNAYLKVGVPLNEDNSQNIAFVGDYSLTMMDSYFGATGYIANQNSIFGNLLYQNEVNESHKFTVGIGGTFDIYDENMERLGLNYSPLIPETAVARVNGVSYEFKLKCGATTDITEVQE